MDLVADQDLAPNKTGVAGADAVSDVGLGAGGIVTASRDRVTKDTTNAARESLEVGQEAGITPAEGAVGSKIALLKGIKLLERR